jgi:hypothetical protein
MGFPDLGRLLAGFLEAQLIAQRFRLVAPHEFQRCHSPDLFVEPVFAHFERRKRAIPAPLPFLFMAATSSTTTTLTGKTAQREVATRSFHCHLALVDGGSFLLLCLRFCRGCLQGVLRPLRVRRILVESASASLTPSLASAWMLR